MSSRTDLARWLVSHAGSLLTPLTVSILARVAGQLLGVALFATAAHAIVTASPANSAPIWVPALLLALVALGKAALRYLEHYAGHWVAFTALQRLRELFFARLIPQVPGATSRRAGAELTSRATSDIDRIEVFFAHTFPPAVAAVMVPVIALSCFGAAGSWPLALTLAAFVLAATVALPLLTSQATWRRAGLVANQRGALAQRVGDDIQGVREVLAFGIEEQRLADLQEADGDLAAERSRAGRQHGYRTAVALLIQIGGLIAVPVVGLWSDAGVAEIAVALAVGIALWAPIQGIDGFAAGLDAAFAATARIREVIDGEAEVLDTGTASLPDDATVSVQDVTFTYDGRDQTLSNVTADFAAGQWNYVLGVSGSGKSTLARLMVRGWDPGEGAIRIGGVDVRDVPLDALRTHVAFVSQRPTMLSGTIAENLRLAAPDASDDDLREALAAVALDPWIESIPEGVEASIAERGLDVSGGQLQRLALARALLARPRVLVLDEALSQLDAETARIVRQRVGEYVRGVTVIELTHRADLVPDAASVVVLDMGRVVEAGVAGVLRESSGAFTALQARH